MNYYEPYQHLKFVYYKRDSKIYILSSINVFMPNKTSLTGREAVRVSSIEATLNYDYTEDDSQILPYTFKYERRIDFMTYRMPSSSISDTALKDELKAAIKTQLAKIGKYTVHSVVYNAKGVVGGQATNTISHEDEVVII